MAAHSITILKEIVRDWEFLAPGEKRGLQDKAMSALSYAPGMDELDHDRWRELREAIIVGDQKAIVDLAFEILGEQIREWVDLNKPRTHEDWAFWKYKDCDPWVEGDGKELRCPDCGEPVLVMYRLEGECPMDSWLGDQILGTITVVVGNEHFYKMRCPRCGWNARVAPSTLEVMGSECSPVEKP